VNIISFSQGDVKKKYSDLEGKKHGRGDERGVVEK